MNEKNVIECFRIDSEAELPKAAKNKEGRGVADVKN